MMRWWQRLGASIEIATRLTAPIQHPALQEAHLEPAMNSTQISQEIKREQQEEAALDPIMEERTKEDERATTRPQSPSRDVRASRAGAHEPKSASVRTPRGNDDRAARADRAREGERSRER
jgi:hypothetical protein